MKQKNILFTDMDGTILFSDNGKTYFKGKRSIGGTLVDLPIFLDN